MTIKELKDTLTIDNIRTLVELMGGVISYEDDDQWISNTICHGGKKQKLYFYKDDKNFHCYSECGHMDIITLVQKVNDFEYINQAINWICIKLNIDNCEYGFGKQEPLDDWKFIHSLKSKRIRNNDKVEEFTILPKSILNMFQPLYHLDWINEGISIETMKKYNISYSTWQQKIVIPHYDINGNLIGIRGRTMIEEEIETFGKYAPLRTGNSDRKFYNHNLGNNLYGLHVNKDVILSKRKIMLVESEKSVLQCDTIFGDDNFTVALCGSNLTKQQIKIILSLKPIEVIIALDRQYEFVGSDEYLKWEKKIKDKFITPLVPYTKVSVLWDTVGLLDYKDSPTDKGKDVLLQLMDDKIYGRTINK